MSGFFPDHNATRNPQMTQQLSKWDPRRFSGALKDHTFETHQKYIELAEPGIDAEFASCVPEVAAGCRSTAADRRMAFALALAEPGALTKARTLALAVAQQAA